MTPEQKANDAVALLGLGEQLVAKVEASGRAIPHALLPKYLEGKRCLEIARSRLDSEGLGVAWFIAVPIALGLSSLIAYGVVQVAESVGESGRGVVKAVGQAASLGTYATVALLVYSLARRVIK